MAIQPEICVASMINADIPNASVIFPEYFQFTNTFFASVITIEISLEKHRKSSKIPKNTFEILYSCLCDLSQCK